MSELEEGLDNLMDSLKSMVGQQEIILDPADSIDADLNKLIKDHIYGLLMEKSLTEAELGLLSALLQTVRIKL